MIKIMMSLTMTDDDVKDDVTESDYGDDGYNDDIIVIDNADDKEYDVIDHVER